MANQAAIEQAAGIDAEVAEYMMARKTSAAKNAMSLLQMLTAHYEPAGMALLLAAVRDCRREMAA